MKTHDVAASPPDALASLASAVAAAGGPSALAHAIGMSPAQLWEIRIGRRPMPAAACEAVWRVTGVRPDRLRPDLDWLKRGGRWYHRTPGVYVTGPKRGGR